MAAADLTTLAPELIRRIIHFADPWSYFNLACTCKALAHQSHYILHRHQEAYRKYRVSSDLHPSTVPTLLRSALGFGDPLLTWHVRTFEAWGTRADWADWKPLTPGSEIPFDPEGESQRWTFAPDEHEAIVSKLRELLGDNAADKATGELERGSDSAIKMLLLLLCPRLTSLKVAEETHFPGRPTALTWLDRALAVLRPSASYPEGLLSLRDLAINVQVRIRSNFEIRTTSCPLSLFANLLHLPSLHAIYVCSLANTTDDEGQVLEHEAEAEALTPGCSSVEHIFIDSAWDVSADSMMLIAAAPRALATLSLRGIPDGYGPWDDIDDLVKSVAAHQAASLRSLMFYRTAGLHGYRNNLFYPFDIEDLLDHDALRVAGIDWQDIDLASENYNVHGEGSNPADNVGETFKTTWPASVEALVIFGTGPDERALALIEKGVIELLRAGTHTNLKAVYLDALEQDRSLPWGEKPWFQEVVEVGRAAGVHVHTVTNREAMEHKVDFPMAIDKFDMASGPWYVADRKSDNGWEVDIYDGAWKTKGCRYCGKCEECLGIYTEEVWNRDVFKTSPPVQ